MMWSNRLICGTVFFVVSFVVSCSRKPADHTHQPVVDIGWLEPFEKRALDVVFQNADGVPLLVKKIASGCGCIRASISHDRVEAGEQVVIRLNVDAAAIQGSEVRQQLHMVVASEGGADRDIEMLVVGRIDRSRTLVASPPAIDFGHITP